MFTPTCRDSHIQTICLSLLILAQKDQNRYAYAQKDSCFGKQNLFFPWPFVKKALFVEKQFKDPITVNTRVYKTRTEPRSSVLGVTVSQTVKVPKTGALAYFHTPNNRESMPIVTGTRKSCRSWGNNVNLITQLAILLCDNVASNNSELVYDKPDDTTKSVKLTCQVALQRGESTQRPHGKCLINNDRSCFV